jgi:hypothetical protein
VDADHGEICDLGADNGMAGALCGTGCWILIE